MPHTPAKVAEAERGRKYQSQEYVPGRRKTQARKPQPPIPNLNSRASVLEAQPRTPNP